MVIETNPGLAAELLAAVRDEAAGSHAYWLARRAHEDAERHLADVRSLAVNDLTPQWSGPRPEVSEDIAEQLLAATVAVARAAAELARADGAAHAHHGAAERVRGAVVRAYDIGWPTGG